MNKSMSPIWAAIAAGAATGTVLASLVLIIGVGQVSSGLGLVLDLFAAFLIGGVLAGGIAALIQWRRLMSASDGSAPPGWYDSPEQDGTQWLWSGTKWTQRTRTAPDRIRRIEPVT